MKFDLSSVRQFSAALVALAIGILGCGKGPSGASPGDGVVPIAGGDAGPGGEGCAVPAMGCPCDAPDSTVSCGQVDRISDGYLSCSLGKRTCGADGSWGACIGDRIAMKKLPAGKQPLALQGAPTVCVANPCDPYCQNFVDTPPGFDAGPTFKVVDAGVTLIGQAGCTGASITPNPKTITVTAFDETAVLTDSAYQIISKLSATKCLNASAVASPTNVDIKTCTAYGNPSGAPPGATPTFKVIDIGGGVYNLKDTSSSTCLDVAGQGTTTGTQIDIRTCSNANQAQTFRLLAMGGGFYEIINTNSDLCLDVTGSSTTNGTLVKQQACTGANNQLWQFVNNPAIAAFRTFTTDTGPVAYTLTPTPAGCLPGGSVAVWATDQPDRVSIASTGNLTANLTVLSGIASTVNVSATVVGVQYTAVATIKVAVSDTALEPAGEAAKYTSTSGIASKVRWLYPYDNTVLPLVLLAPVPQYQLSSGGAASSIKVSLRYPTSGTATFSWSAVVAEPSPLRYTFPQNVWQAFEQSSRGSSGLIVIQRYAGSLESESTRTVKFADGQMKGTVYYMSYNSGIGGSNSSNVSASQVGSVLAIKPGGLQPSVAIPSRQGKCNVCHTVSLDGTKLMLMEDDYHTGTLFDTATGNVSYTSPFIEASDCTASAPCCVGAHPSSGTCSGAGGTCQKCSYTGYYQMSQSGYRFSFGALYPDSTFGMASNESAATTREFAGSQNKGTVGTNRASGGTGTGTASGAPCPASTDVTKSYDGLMTMGSFSKWCVPTAPGGMATGTPVSTMYQFAGATSWPIVSYAITSADNNAVQDPKDWTFQGCSTCTSAGCATPCTAASDTNWTTLDTQAGEDFLTRYQMNSYIFTNATAYRQYRLRVTANDGDATKTTGGTITKSIGGASNCSASETEANVFDGKQTANNFTKWCVGGGAPSAGTPFSIMYKFAAGTTWVLTRYTITAGNDSPARDPKSWTFQGCTAANNCSVSSDTNWVTLDTRSNQTFASRRQTNTYTPFTSPTGAAYDRYRLRVTANNGDAGTFQFGELGMFTTAAPGNFQIAELQMSDQAGAPAYPVNPSTDVNGIAQAWPYINGYPAGITSTHPAFSPGGNRFAFNFWSGSAVNGVAPGAGKSIAVMDFDCNRPGSTATCGTRSLATPWTFSNARELFRGGVASYGANGVNTTPYLFAAFPAFLPDNNAALFQATVRKPCPSGCPNPNTGQVPFDTWMGAQSEIWMSNVTASSAAPSSPVRLNNLNGTGYIPGSTGAPATPTATANHVSGNTVNWTNANGCGSPPDALSSTITEDQLNYAPTIAPKETAGYYWALFTSRRQYGNVASGKAWQYENCVLSVPSDPPTKKLWVAAINKSWTAGTDASFPAFYLPGQELLAGNTNAYWVASACLAAGSTGTANICQTDDDCCGGTATPQTAQCVVDAGTNPVTRHCQTIAAACKTIGVACTMTSQCCAGTTCTGAVCLGAPAYTSQSFTRDYSASCAAGTRVTWRFFDWEATETSDDHIDFSAQSWNTGFAPGTLLLFGTASAPSNPASWTGVDVGAAFKAAALPTGTNLRITFTFVPSVSLQYAPVLVNWRQAYDCLPAE